jgi:hypothetical protein
MFGRKPKELLIPPAARGDAEAIELARIWAAGGKQHVTLAAWIWDDPAAWGIMLADFARHLANYYNEQKGLDRNEALARIRMGLDAGWGNSATDADGKVLQ